MTSNNTGTFMVPVMKRVLSSEIRKCGKELKIVMGTLYCPTCRGFPYMIIII